MPPITCEVQAVIADKPIKKIRPFWRQRLVLVERGVGNGLRQDSILYVHAFTATLIVLVGMVSGLLLAQWALIGLGLTLLFGAEFMNQALRSFAATWDPIPPTIQRAMTMSAAGVMCTWLGVVITAVLTLIVRWQSLMGS